VHGRFVAVVDLAESDPLQLVHVPATTYAAASGVDETLVRAEVEVQVARFAGATFGGGGEAAAAGAALRGLLGIERVEEVGSWAGEECLVREFE